MRAAWGDLDADGLLDVAVSSSSGESLLVIPGDAADPFEQELLAGMTGTRLQFGNFDTEQGEHGSNDRDLDNPSQRLASGMDIAAHRSWQGIDYSEVSQQGTVRFLDSDSTLFDIPMDLVVLDEVLAALEPQLRNFDTLELEERNNKRLDSQLLVQFELGRGTFEASYALFRLPRSLFEDGEDSFHFNANTGVQEAEPENQSALIELARTGAGSELDAFLLDHREQWQLLGNGAFNQTPLTFRHDPDFVYFLGIDDNLIDVRGNKRSDLLNAPFDLSELIDTSDLVVHDDPLPLAQKQSPIQAAARKLLADLAHLTTIRNAQGEPVQAIPDAVDLEPWRKVFTQEIQGLAILNWLVDQNDQASSFSGDLSPDSGAQDSNANEIEGVEVLLEFLNNQSLGNALTELSGSLGSFEGNGDLSSGSFLTDGSSVLVNQIVGWSAYGGIKSDSLEGGDLPVFVNPLSSLSESFNLLPWVEQLLNLVENQPILSLRGQGQSLSTDVDFASLKESESELIVQSQQELSSSSELTFDFDKTLSTQLVEKTYAYTSQDQAGPLDVYAIYDISPTEQGVVPIKASSKFFVNFSNIYSTANQYSEVWPSDGVGRSTFAGILMPSVASSVGEGGWSTADRQWNNTHVDNYYLTRIDFPGRPLLISLLLIMNWPISLPILSIF